jgi:signal peptidase I
MIKDGDLIMFYRLDKNYAIGDILVLKYRGEYQTRRVVAKTGDIVDVTESGLSVNGVIQHEPEIYQQTSRYENDISFPLTVGENQFFVLGDARENATDSRVYGPVDARDTLGKVITVISRRNL